MINNCSETNLMIEISIFGDNFNPNELTQLIGINPTEIYFKGDEIQNQKSEIFTKQKLKYRQETNWSYSTGYVETIFLEELFMQLIDKFNNKIDIINKYTKMHGLEVKIDLVVEIINKQTPALYLNKKIIEFLYLLNTEIDFDTYVI